MREYLSSQEFKLKSCQSLFLLVRLTKQSAVTMNCLVFIAVTLILTTFTGA